MSHGAIWILIVIISFVDAGQNYQAGDVLTFPDVQGYNISGAPTSGAGGISFRVATTTFGDAADAAAYSHNQSLHNVLPCDTQVSSNVNVAYPQVSNIVETTTPFDYESDPTQHTHTIVCSGQYTTHYLVCTWQHTTHHLV